MFQLILPFQLDLPFDPAPAGANGAEDALEPAADPTGSEASRLAATGRPARVRRPRVRARAGSPSLELQAQELSG